jgi:site-specific DNA-cytosine methylase
VSVSIDQGDSGPAAPERVYTALFPFGGLGAGARGFLEAEARLVGVRARFRLIGGIDIDPEACADFEYLTGSPSLCADVAKLTPDALRAFAGERAPDCVFSSPPCTGYTTLIDDTKSEEERYQALNRLVLTWVELMLDTWGDAPPKLFLLENVPNIANRGRALLDKVKKLLRAAGYLFSEGYHDCGVWGGLAQHRRRFLLIARHAKSLPEILYQPPSRRVRGCGEVVGALPLPGSPEAGPMHAVPVISAKNWLRLALIPPGGDWHALAPAKAAAHASSKRAATTAASRVYMMSATAARVSPR